MRDYRKNRPPKSENKSSPLFFPSQPRERKQNPSADAPLSPTEQLRRAIVERKERERLEALAEEALLKKRAERRNYIESHWHKSKSVLYEGVREINLLLQQHTVGQIECENTEPQWNETDEAFGVDLSTTGELPIRIRIEYDGERFWFRAFELYGLQELISERYLHNLTPESTSNCIAKLLLPLFE